jgi:hypothetical protein
MRMILGVWCTGGTRCTLILLLTLLLLSGCSSGEGLSHYEQLKLGQQQAADAIVSVGGSVAEKEYPQGTAWVIDLSSATIDDKVIQHIQTLGKIAELNLSGSTITNQQLAAIVQSGALSVTIKLDISKTQLSDAGLMELAGLHLIYEINAKDTLITPAGIKQYQEKRPSHPFNMPIKIVK